MKVICDWCVPPRVLFEKEPLEDVEEVHTICHECYTSMMETRGIEPVRVPENLGKCEILKVHDDGDLTVECKGQKYVVTTEGDVFVHYTGEKALEKMGEYDYPLGTSKGMWGPA